MANHEHEHNRKVIDPAATPTSALVELPSSTGKARVYALPPRRRTLFRNLHGITETDGQAAPRPVVRRRPRGPQQG
jgi:hypothetical protein